MFAFACPSLSKVRWALKHQASISGSIDKALEKQFPGEYSSKSRRFWYWARQYRQQKWELVSDQMAAKVSQLPNCVRKRVPGCPLKGPSSERYELPEKLQEQMHDQLEKLASGEDGAMPRSEHIRKRDVVTSVKWLVDSLNTEIKEQSQEMQNHNEALLKSFIDGEVGVDALQENWRHEPEQVKAKQMKHLAKKMADRMGFKKQACNTSGSYLDYDDIKMIEFLAGHVSAPFASSIVFDLFCFVAWCRLNSTVVLVCRSRERFREKLDREGIPLQLVLNYDQTWINAFRTPKTTMRKTKNQRATREQVRILNITGGRAGLSLCTSSWANGDRGPLFVSLAPKSISAEFVRKMNATLAFCLVTTSWVQGQRTVVQMAVLKIATVLRTLLSLLFCLLHLLCFLGKVKASSTSTETKKAVILWRQRPQSDTIMNYWPKCSICAERNTICTGVLGCWWPMPSQAISGPILEACQVKRFCLVGFFRALKLLLGWKPLYNSSCWGCGLLRHKFAKEMNIFLPSLEPGGWSAWGQPQDWFWIGQRHPTKYCFMYFGVNNVVSRPAATCCRTKCIAS